MHFPEVDLSFAIRVHLRAHKTITFRVQHQRHSVPDGKYSHNYNKRSSIYDQTSEVVPRRDYYSSIQQARENGGKQLAKYSKRWPKKYILRLMYVRNTITITYIHRNRIEVVVEIPALLP
jgi:hypothetical protein